MFKVDMEAIREAATEARLMANPAKLANADNGQPVELATLAKLAVSQHTSTHIDPVLQDLLEAAMRACDAWKDGPEAREQMRRDCIDTPPHLRADLRDHFNQTYGDNGT